MTSRRGFLQLGATALGIMSMPMTAVSGIMGNQRRNPFDRVIYDDRFTECLSFKKEAERLGATTYGIQGDVSELWYGDLRDYLAGQSGLIAGMTTESSAFLLKILGHDVFHHQVFRADHINQNGKFVGHRFTAPEYLINQAVVVSQNHQTWSVDMARLLSLYDRKRPCSAKVTIKTSIKEDLATENLVSWIIAPLPRI